MTTVSMASFFLIMWRSFPIVYHNDRFRAFRSAVQWFSEEGHLKLVSVAGTEDSKYAASAETLITH
jgi:hypothetical protein